MDLDKAMIIAGVGCRRGAAVPDIEAAILMALAHAGIKPADLTAIATSTSKQAEPGISAAAAKFGVNIKLIPQAELEAVGERVATRSDRILALVGVPSLAEAAALAAAGPSARLIAARLVVGSVTCALAASEVAQ
jgi:cobalt-precorrin 5A hydrolase